MKAVNLIPRGERRGASAISRSGGGAYLVLGTLVALVLMASVYAIEGNRIDSQKAEAAQANQEAAAVEAQAAELAEYSTFAQLADKRFETVQSLANSRFDWSNTLHDLAAVIPPNTWLTTLRGTVSPGVTVEGGGGGASGVRGAIPTPAIEISGCTTSQPAVARMMARMRLMNGVQRVTLTSSEKADSAPAAGGSTDSAADNSDCRSPSDQYPRFEIVVFFEAPAATTTQPAADPAAATATTPGASQ